MTSLELTGVDGADRPAQREPVSMVSHLKRLVESLPVCVMRCDLEGCLLAVNDSALQLLGATDHARVLGKSLTERINAEHVEDWRNFLRRGWEDTASSVECELVDFVGAHRIVQIKAVAQRAHVDGIPSLIITAQDLSLRRRLERALNEHEGCAGTIAGLETAIQEAEAERQRLANELELLHAQIGQRSAEQELQSDAHVGRVAELEAALAQHDLEATQRCDDLTARLAEATAALQDLRSQLEQRDAQYHQLLAMLEQRDAEHHSADLVKDARIEELQRMLTAKESEWQKQRDDQAAEHQASLESLRQQIEECERALTENDDAWKQRCEELATQLTSRDEQGRERWEKLNAQLVEHAAERQRLGELVADREAERDRAIAEQQRLGELHAAEKAEIEKQLHSRNAEYQRLMDEANAPRGGDEPIDPKQVQRLMKSLAAHRIELVQITENSIRTLEPMATAGRVAIASSRELQSAIEAVDARSRHLLEQCALDDGNRPEIESLRRDAIAAASLVRQLLQVFGESARSAAPPTP